MKLSDKNIKTRLRTFTDIGLNCPPKEILERISKKDIPKELDDSLKQGLIIIDPMPDLEIYLGSSTIDLDLGNKLEVPNVPFEVAKINNETTIRLFVVDFRDDQHNRLLLEQHAGVTQIDQSWKRFDLKENEIFELPVSMQVNIFTRQVICVPYNLEANLDGRSCFARKGITTHITSSRFDAGFCGFLTLEVKNGGSCNFNLIPGMRIASLSFNQLSSEVSIPYLKKKRAKFSGQH
ncbi:MAG: dCTP deaminase [Patescibacteria group bacterium]